MPAIPPLPADPRTATLADIGVGRARLPAEVTLGEELGRGANNRVYAAEHEGRECVLRAPRRRSDTQQRGSALWEFRHTLRAAQLGVGPAVHAAWCARHAEGRWPSGLYVLMERFDDDLEAALVDPAARDALPAVGRALAECLHALARERILVYDLKPSNVVVRVDADAPTVRVIDFGRDFCEWGGCAAAADAQTPTLDLLDRRLRARDADAPAEEREALATHVLFATMMVILSATTTHVLYEDRAEHRMDAAARRAAHPLAALTRELLDGMQGQNVALVRELLRTDAVRGVLAHYHGRRCAGTRRTLALARGEERRAW
jgi:hypothetical protein